MSLGLSGLPDTIPGIVKSTLYNSGSYYGNGILYPFLSLNSFGLGPISSLVVTIGSSGVQGGCYDG